jgi:hypothetical protein
MITLEDTEAAVKRCEQHLQRAATDYASPKAKVLATEISGQDTAAELAALSRRLPRLKTLKSRRYRPSCVANHRVPSVRAMASQLKRTWPRRLATRRRQTCPSASRLAKKQRLTPPLLLLIRPLRPLRPPRTRTTPRVIRLYTAACLTRVRASVRPALYLIVARKSISLKEPSDPAPAFSLPVSQALKEQMPCSPYSPDRGSRY